MMLADTTTATPQQQPGGAYQLFHSLLTPLILIMGIMWVLLILPKRKQDKSRQQMLDNMKRGDEIQTIGGIIGKVVEPKEDRVLVKVDESSNTKIWFARSAIAKVTADDGKGK
jgi:preprotein translocase subunit YajC